MPAPERIKQLVETFEQNLNDYRFNKNETELRRQFLDPFFEALGWDVDNKQGKDERHKEVAHEFSVEIDGQQKKADYAFRTEKDVFDFLVEAKKPSVKVESNKDAAFQIRSYGWSAKLPINILTDFEHFAIYDCRIRPNYAKDDAKTGRIAIFDYKEYIARWDEIAKLFSADAIRNGALDEYTDGLKTKKGTQEVDDAFLEEIEGWREALAKNIAIRNKAKNLNEEQINFAVQMTIDRVIFLRIAEERGMEKDRRLFELIAPDPHPASPRYDNKNLGKKEKDSMSDLGEVPKAEGVYKQLLKFFTQADERYNSGLFHFKKDKERENPDTLSGSLEIDDKVLKDIIKDLYYPSPYAFTYIPTEILGSVYERFLGKVIRLTAGGNAKVEEKPEVRKAGGVYYTPSYIVEYIVKNTVGKLLGSPRPLGEERGGEGDLTPNPSPSRRGGLTPDEVSKIKIVDPACGSGSFLLGAYQFLLDWHLDWYASNQTEKWVKNKTLLTADNKTFRLSIDEKKRILLNNIHGVDLDPQAVEVSKLSLLLKVVEDPGQLKMFEEGHILPNLNKNIKNGNALIGTDYFSGQMFNDMEEMKRIKPFDWNNEFPEIFKRGGFDAVIGNPPYIRIQTLQEGSSINIEFFKKRYKAASKGNYDIYVIFIEKALEVLNKQGEMGFILPSKFFATDYGESIRNVISQSRAISKIIDFGHLQIFEQATTYTCLLFLAKSPQEVFKYAKIKQPNELGVVDFRIIQNSLTNTPWEFSDEENLKLINKINSISIPLSALPTRIGRGSSSGADDVFILRKEDQKLFTRQGEEVKIEEDILRHPIYATDFGRYEFRPAQEEVIIFPYKVKSDSYELIDETEFKMKYPKAYSYLASRKKELQERKQFRQWFGYSAPRNLDVHETAQILVPLLADRGLYCRISDDAKNLCLMASGGFSITVSNNSELSPNFVLGLLNSTLLFWRLRSISNVFRGGWITCTKQYVETLPIRKINFNDPAEKSKHDKMVSLVEQMLALHKSLAGAKTPQDKELIQRQITSTDKAIDGLVYELYGLSEEEIGIVEG